MARVLYAYSRDNTFTRIDREALAERFDVVEYYQEGLRPRLGELRRRLRGCDVVYGWFASWHTLAALTLADRLGIPSVLVIGGFDTARMPEIGYGSQRWGPRRWLSRWTMSRATRLVTNSRYSLEEIERNLGFGAGRVAVVHHGIPDRFAGRVDSRPRDAVALTVGVVYRGNLERKGHEPFIRAAARLPEVEFVLAGKESDDAAGRLRELAGANVTLTGYLSDDQLDELFLRAAVYVQASRHEGFGLSLAEAMLAGCVPVATTAGALAEVTGDVGVTIADATAAAVADGVREALELGPGAGARARARVRERFSYEMRRDGICAEVEAALRGERSGE